MNAAPAQVAGRSFQGSLRLTEGANTIEVVATDPAGNVGRATATVTLHDRPAVAIVPDGTWWTPGAEQRRHAEQTQQPLWFENAQGMRFVLVPPGTFTMGDGEQSDNPPHQVTLTRGFYLGATEVTNSQFRRLRGSHNSGASSGRSLNGDTQPVVNVSWDDAQAFVAWLSQQDGGRRQYRLPTEAEWECACRAGRQGDAARYPWGGTWPPSGRAGNYADESAGTLGFTGIDGYDDGNAVSSPAGSFDASPWGLYDMGGNVWEWCSDWYDARSCRAQATDPQGATSGSARLLRGASWNDYDREYLHSATRSYVGPRSLRSENYVGFRVVADGAASRP